MPSRRKADLERRSKKVSDVEQIIPERETKKGFNVLGSTKQKPNSNEEDTTCKRKFGYNNKPQITTYLYLTLFVN
jgi:hypothetical protein